MRVAVAMAAPTQNNGWLITENEEASREYDTGTIEIESKINQRDQEGTNCPSGNITNSVTNSGPMRETIINPNSILDRTGQKG